MKHADVELPAELLVAFRHGKGPAAWAERHRTSPVPGRWPYGLDGLADHARTDAVELPELRGLRRRAAGLRGRLPWTPSVAASRVALCWDELSALDMVASVRAERFFSGVIWATDSVAAGRETPELRRIADGLRRLDGLWVLSRPQVDAVRDWLGDDCPPVHFLRFGVDPEFYRQRPYPSAPHVVSVGGDRDRDPATLFSALDLVRRRRGDVTCTVQSTSDLTPPAGVTKVGRLTHSGVAALLAEASVVAIATRPNLHASGMTVGLEAMAVGRPVVACATPGMEDYFAGGVDSELVAPADPQAMADAILGLLDDRDRAARFGEAGHRAVTTRHTTVTMCRDLAALVRD